MTTTPETKPQTDTVSLTIDGVEVTVPKGTLIIRAAEQVGVQVPRFCDHPLLDPVGACRQCIVDVEGQKKPLTACTSTVTEGMVVRTQLTSEMARKAQAGTLEFLLINHPLDCPICDKGGECPLQNQTLTNGNEDSRFRDVKRTYAKPIPISAQVLLDRERCVLCARCTRFSQQIAGDPFIELFERSALQQVAIYVDEPFESYFSGNTIQICPVGALTSATYRFRARPFDLVSTPAACEHCASGCALRVDARRGKVLRRLAGSDPAVNDEWNCDRGRFAFTYATQDDRLTSPMVRGNDGQLHEVSWSEAIERAAGGLRAARRSAVLTGGRLTLEDAYAYSKFARVVLGTNSIDFRARHHSAEEAEFLAARVAGRLLETTYDDLDAAPAVLLVGFEPEEESPIVFLRLRKRTRTGALDVYAVTSMVSGGFRKLSATTLVTAPGDVPALLGRLAGSGLADEAAEAAAALRQPGAVILAGERLAQTPGALSAVAQLADATGAKLGWVPRRAGDRGALEAGCLPGLLPGGAPVADAAARAAVGAVWGAELPAEPGLSLDEALAASSRGELDALLVAGVEVDDLADPAGALTSLGATFIVSLEIRRSALTDRAHVVLPVASAQEKPGTFVDWEGRPRSFRAQLPSDRLTDQRVLGALADGMGTPLRLTGVDAVRTELAAVGGWSGARPGTPAAPAAEPAPRADSQLVVDSWKLLLDLGRMQDGEPHLAATARRPRASINAATAQQLGVDAGGELTISSDRGTVTLPVAVGDVADGVVWLPANSVGSRAYADLGVVAGSVVTVVAAGAAVAQPDTAEVAS
ncbi:MAG TPA: NADH-quinone oxidoreductase subunit G [Mycobacteriales bacterium]|nr:NADH-quinone oxidoreductase subunit G [Mycobacteriales bacterium]